MALYVELDAGESVRIGSGTTVRVEKKKGQRVRLCIVSDYKVTMERANKIERPQGAQQPIDIERPKRS